MRGLKELFLPHTPPPPVSLPEMQDATVNQDSYLDPGTEAFLDQFRRSLSKVPNLTGQFDLRKRKLKAKGGYALVYEAPWTSPEALPGTPPIQVCYKELLPPVANAPERIGIIRKTIRRLAREVQIWKDLNHPNIIEFIGYAIEGERSDMKAVLVSKWCTNGDIVEYLKADPNSNRIQLIQGVARGLQYLHSRNPVIIHGDLKPHNVVISDEGTAKLCDFGLSRIVSELSKTAESTSIPGFTIRYSAYEVLDGTKTIKSDIYGYGCTCIYILFGQHPFRGIKNDLVLFRAIAEGQSPWVWDETVPVEKTLSRCCQLEQKSRPSIENVLEELCLVQAPISETQIEGESSSSSSESFVPTLPRTTHRTPHLPYIVSESNPSSPRSFGPPPTPCLPFIELPLISNANNVGPAYGQTPSAQPDTLIYLALIAIWNGPAREPYPALTYESFARFDIVTDMDELLKVSPPPLPSALALHDVTDDDWARYTSDIAATWQPNQSRSEKSLQRTSIMITTWNAQFFLRRGIHFILENTQDLDDDDPWYPPLIHTGSYIGGGTRKRDAKKSYFMHVECLSMRGRPGALPSGPIVPGANGSISREPNPSIAYAPFKPFYIMPDMDEFLELFPEVPPLPAALVSHDVTHDDWNTCMRDIVAAWQVDPHSWITEPSQRAGVMITSWNSRFFFHRGVHLIFQRVQSSDGDPTEGQAGSGTGQWTQERDAGGSYSLSVECVSMNGKPGALTDGLMVPGANGPTSRDPNPAKSYAPFASFSIITDIHDYFDGRIGLPPFPAALLSHDVALDDWDSCMRDFVVALRFNPPSWVTKPSQRIAIVISTWNSEFFFRRGVQMIFEPVSTGSRAGGRVRMGIDGMYTDKLSYSLRMECISMRGKPGGMPGSPVFLGANGPIGRQPPPDMAYAPFMSFHIEIFMDKSLQLDLRVPRLPAKLVSRDVMHDDWDSYMRDVVGALKLNPQSRLTMPSQRASIIIATWNAHFFLCRGIYVILERTQKSESDDNEDSNRNRRRSGKRDAKKSYSLRVECVPTYDLLTTG